MLVPPARHWAGPRSVKVKRKNRRISYTATGSSGTPKNECVRLLPAFQPAPLTLQAAVLLPPPRVGLQDNAPTPLALLRSSGPRPFLGSGGRRSQGEGPAQNKGFLRFPPPCGFFRYQSDCGFAPTSAVAHRN